MMMEPDWFLFTELCCCNDNNNKNNKTFNILQNHIATIKNHFWAMFIPLEGVLQHNIVLKWKSLIELQILYNVFNNVNK